MKCILPLFRNFTKELMKNGFHQFYGLFSLTSEGLLYPNADACCTVPDFMNKYYCLGLMFADKLCGGKVYEGNMDGIQFADFFLCKLLNANQGNTSICYLKSLDPELYKYKSYIVSFFRFIKYLRF